MQLPDPDQTANGRIQPRRHGDTEEARREAEDRNPNPNPDAGLGVFAPLRELPPLAPNAQRPTPTLVIATGNRKKGVEMAQILGDLPIRVLTLADFPDIDAEVEEIGCTYAENAELKARAAAEKTGFTSIADDAGLEIDALQGAPGVYSKRFLGEETPFPEKMARILSMLRDVPEGERGCRFRCAVAIIAPDGRAFHCQGICEGSIGHEMRGEYGFGYDPIFYLPELGRHMAELPPEEKHRISHRGKALACAREVLTRLFAS